ncbi:ABC transporter permease [Devosia sp.]|uniref:ABC transporter permease n=1 Tax=Devosia sp. TaxID=1871048 RepID=UPI003BA911C5
MTAHIGARPLSGRLALNRLGVFLAVLGIAGLTQPFLVVRANRIAAGVGQGLFSALPAWQAILLLGVLAAALGATLLQLAAVWRAMSSILALLGLAAGIGAAATALTPPGDALIRIAPGTGFWLLLLAFSLLSADGFARLRPNPWQRVGALVVVALAIALLLSIGTLNDISILREYATRADVFWREGRTHIELALGSLVAATIVGVPLGIVCQRTAWLRAPVLNTLNAVQTIPSIALFGLLIAPLAWVAATVPGASVLGISGIGAAPALLALFAYSLLPVVANTLVGIEGVPPAAEEAAKGMGMTDWQRLTLVQFPLAFPVILTGIRIVLVQNIGLATIAALIGGGGFGVFVFQGVGQTAMDLVLLGAVPTIALSFAAAIVLDAAVELATPGGVSR